MILLLALVPLLQADDAYTLTLQFARQHCDECKAEVEAIVRKIPGFRSVTFAETSAAVELSEKTPPPSPAGLPKDMGYRGASVSIRGTASVSGDKVSFVAKGSGATLALAGRLDDLKKALGGKNRFHVTGALSGRTLELESFKPVDW